MLEADPAVTRIVTGPVTPQTTRRYAAFARKSRPALGPLSFFGVAGGNASGKRYGRPNVAGVSVRETIPVSATQARTMPRKYQ